MSFCTGPESFRCGFSFGGGVLSAEVFLPAEFFCRRRFSVSGGVFAGRALLSGLEMPLCPHHLPQPVFGVFGVFAVPELEVELGLAGYGVNRSYDLTGADFLT